MPCPECGSYDLESQGWEDDENQIQCNNCMEEFTSEEDEEAAVTVDEL